MISRTRWVRLVTVVLVLSLVLSGCLKPSEREVADRKVETSRTMANDLINARMDNRSIESVSKEFAKYQNRINKDVWDMWFAVNYPTVEGLLRIVEDEGYVPVGSSIDTLNYGKQESGDGYSFIGVSTMDAVDETGNFKKKVRVYFMFDFNDDGELINYGQIQRELEESQ